jgi:formylglycine-generating enzyme required for sulfatase activity
MERPPSEPSLIVWRGLLAILTLVIGIALLRPLGVAPEPVVNLNRPPASPAPPFARGGDRALEASVAEESAPPLVAPTAGIPSMIAIAAGEFWQGCDPAHNGGYACNDDELPLRRVYIPAYAIDRTEVTNAAYAACVDAGACEAPHSSGSNRQTSYFRNPLYANHPVLFVSWEQADTYCRWAGKRLPTEAEWEKAARGPGEPQPFPWGSGGPGCERLNYWDDPSRPCVGDAARVGEYAANISPYGARDMAGNAQEWVSDWYDANYYGRAPRTSPAGPPSGNAKVVRGGSWRSESFYVRVSSRQRQPASSATDSVGFRCAMSVEQ